MKKLFLLPILFLVLGCSSNEMEESEQEIVEANPDDPLIGEWDNISFDDIGASFNSFDEFKVDGTYEIREYSFSDSILIKGTWRNKDVNISEQIQTYIIDGVENEASFEKWGESEEFNFVTLTNKETGDIIILDRYVEEFCDCVTPPTG